MIVKQKKGAKGAIRITLTEEYQHQNVDYVLIEPNQCWCSTFDAWGKTIDNPIIDLAGKQYRVILEEVK